MKVFLEIKGKREKPFKGDDGSERPYFWYKAERQDNGVTITFGSTNGEHEIGTHREYEIEKYEKRDGTFGYREIVEN